MPSCVFDLRDDAESYSTVGTSRPARKGCWAEGVGPAGVGVRSESIPMGENAAGCGASPAAVEDW